MGTSVRRAKPEARWAHPIDWRGADPDGLGPLLIPLGATGKMQKNLLRDTYKDHLLALA